MARKKKETTLGSTEKNIQVGDYVMYRPGIVPGDFYGTVTEVEKRPNGDIIHVELEDDGGVYFNYECHFKVIIPKNKR